MQSDNNTSQSEVLIIVCFQVRGCDDSFVQKEVSVRKNNVVKQIEPPNLAPIELGEVVSSMRSDGSVCFYVV